MADVREAYDILFDRVVDRLETYAAAEKAADDARDFDVRPDSFRALGRLQAGAHVLVYSGSVNIQQERSATAVSYGYEYTLYTDCIAFGAREVNTGQSDIKSDRKAGIRLRYLTTQVLRALYNPNDWELGFDPEVVGKRGAPQIEFLQPDAQQSERVIVGARITHTFEMAWEPDEMTTTGLTDISVDSALWQGLFQP